MHGSYPGVPVLVPMIYLCRILRRKGIYMTKRLCKSMNDRKLAGVCGGIAEYFGIDSTIVRLILVIFCLAAGSGVLFYIIAAIVMPEA